MKFKTPFIKPIMPDTKEIGKVYDNIVSSNWFTNFGPQEQKFSLAIEKYIGQGVFAATVSNATLGLILAVKVLMSPLKTKTKNKVLIPSFTFAAVPESLEWSGLKPVYIDIDESSLQMKFSEAEQYINKHINEIAGILFCNIFGVGASKIIEWEKLARRYKLPLVVDSAAGFGSRYKEGNLLGARGDCEIFSFHSTKPFGIGEGGAIVSRSKQLIAKLQSLENFGFNDKREVTTLGLNAKLQEINAAIGLWRLGSIESSIRHRQEVQKKYKDLLSPIGYTFQDNADLSTVCFVTAIAENKELAAKAYKALRLNGVEACKYYNPPLHKQNAFKNYDRVKNLDITEDICTRILSLPAHHEISDNVLNRIVSIIKKSQHTK